LAATLEAALAHAPELRLVPVPASACATDDRAMAGAAGANVVVRGAVHRAGTELRVTFVARDPVRALDLGGAVVDGSVMQPFDLEDRVAREAAKLLGSTTASAPRPTSDPAAAERLQRARAWLKRNDVDAMVLGAVQELEHLHAEAPADPEVMASLAVAYLYRYRETGERRWHADAARVCERAVEIAQYNMDVLIATGELALISGATERATQAFERAGRERPAVDAALGLARARMQAGSLDQAATHAVAACAAWPEDWRTHNLLGAIRYRQGEARAAAACWRRVVELVPDSSRGWRNLGSAQYRLGDFGGATCAYERALAIQPDARTYSNLATVLHYSGRADQAIAAFRKATELSPGEAVHWGNLGNACRWSPGREAEAPPALERAIALMRDQLARNPHDADGWARLAGWHANLGCAHEARMAIGRALALAPDDVACLMHAARVALVLGDTAQGLSRARDAVMRGYGVGELRNDPQFANLRANPEFLALLEWGRGGGESGHERSGRHGSQEEGREEEGREEEGRRQEGGG
ncbi:MAG TPA: tetratricopeptide repeat protein, partial [Candidatus Eisenbacteria bacterium]|nr:tetratricopeptide repeat protein [Candidatus Eisenbacteria bacterium]